MWRIDVSPRISLNRADFPKPQSDSFRPMGSSRWDEWALERVFDFGTTTFRNWSAVMQLQNGKANLN